MAKKEETKIVLEREYNVPLRREWLKAPKYRRSKKAGTALKEFLIKHMKPTKDDKGHIQLKIGKHLNEKIWANGIKNPPHHVKIVTTKDDKGLVKAELEGVKVEAPKEDKKGKKEAPKVEAKEAPKTEKKVDEKEAKTKKIEKEELETIKKEEPKVVKEETKNVKEVEAKPNAPDHE